MLRGDGAPGQAGFDVGSQHPEDVSEGEVGVANPSQGGAPPGGHQQIAASPHRPPGELGHQSGLAGAGLADDEDHSSLARQRPGELIVQGGQLALPGDERVLSAKS